MAPRRTPRDLARLPGRHSARVPLALAAIALLPLAPRAAFAQREVQPLPQWEVRVDGVLSPQAGALAGAGLNVRAGWYARLGVTAYAGAVRRGEAWESRQRVEGTARFMFDPFAERARGFYAGAGLGAERAAGGTTRGLLLGVVGIEGATDRKVTSSIELTIGGGARLGVVLRHKRRQGR